MEDLGAKAGVRAELVGEADAVGDGEGEDSARDLALVQGLDERSGRRGMGCVGCEGARVSESRRWGRWGACVFCSLQPVTPSEASEEPRDPSQTVGTPAFHLPHVLRCLL